MKKALIAVAMTLLLAALAPATATSGDYLVHSCRLPDGRPAPIDGWVHASASDSAKHHDRCAAGGRFGLISRNRTEPANRPIAGWRFDAAGARIIGATVEFWGATSPAKVGAEPLIQTDPALPGGGIHCSAFLACIYRKLEFPPAPLPDPTFGWSLLLYCTSTFAPKCEFDPPYDSLGNFEIANATFKLADDAPPVVRSSSGSLTSSDVRTLRIDVRDDLSGVAGAAVEVDGVRIVQRAANDPKGQCVSVGAGDASREYTTPKPCPMDRRFDLDVPNSQLSPGKHTLRAWVFDAAGNAVDVVPPTGITVDKSERGVAGKSGGDLVRADFGRTVKLTGTASESARLELVISPVGGVRPPAPISESADANGHYSFAFTARSNADLRISSADGLLLRKLRLRVRSRLQVQAARRHLPPLGRLRLTGRIPTAATKRAPSVAIEVRGSDGWRTIGVTRASRQGRFKFAYRFRATRHGSFRFRARALPSSDLAVEAVPSRPVVVRVG